MNFSQDHLGNKLGNASHVQHQPTQHQADFCSCQINEKQGLMCIKFNLHKAFFTNINLSTLWEVLWKKVTALCLHVCSYESSQSK